MNAQQDLIEAIRDAAALRAGIISPKLAHPDAHLLASGDSNLLQQMAIACVPPEMRNKGNPAGVFGLGLSTPALKNTLASLLRSATVGKLTGHARHRAFCDMRTLKSFKPHDFPRADLDLELVAANEAGELPEMLIFDSGTLTANISTWGRNISITRQVILNDDVKLLAGIVGNAGANAARLEAGIVYGLLESNPTLADGESLFHVDHGNLVASALDSSGLAAGLAALKTQPTPAGIAADLDAAYLVVAAELELAARTLLHAAGMDSITVIAAAALPSGRWYLFADPAQAPVIALLHLESGSDGVSIGPTGNRDGVSRDGVQMGIRFDAGVVTVGRVGAVRGGV